MMANKAEMKPRREETSTLKDKSAIDYLYISDTDKTFQHDDQLPSLPLPTLRDTLSKYLDTVRPHVNEEDFAATEALSKEFEEGIGATLQQKLVERAKVKPNWLEEWWLDCAYLQLRQPLIPYQNMAGPQPPLEYWPPLPGSRVDRAALTMFLDLKFWKMVRNENLRPMIHKGVPWSMDQFRRIFNSVRIPGDPKDELRCPFKTVSEGPAAPTNAVVMYRGYVFSFNCILGPDEDYLTPQEIAYQLYYIEKWCQAQKSEGPGIAALTVTDRSAWAKSRSYLRSLHPDNARNLDIIENGLFSLSFEDSEPLTQAEILLEVMGGDCTNRWADKSMSTIYFKNGLSGASCDHTPMDGFCTAVVTHYVISSLNECKGVYKGVNEFRDLPKPERLDFVVDNKLSGAIDRAKSEFRTNSDDIEVLVNSHTGYGKSALREHRFHPEAFVQVALQLAYYRMYGVPASTYVTASTRKYFHGRTETCRACFPENVEFAKAVIQGSASPGELYTLLQKAVTKFQQMMSEAMDNSGCDRHFLGLYMASQEEGIDLPPIFADPAFLKSGGGGNYILSTSCAGYWSVAGGVPPMREDGYGCFYGIEDNRITFTCTAYKRCPETNLESFFQNILLSLQNMQLILSSSKL